MKELVDKNVYRKLWIHIKRTIEVMGRPERLFTVDSSKTALLVIDMQEGFCAPWGCLENPETRKIVKNINSITNACRRTGIPVVWIRFMVRKNNSNAGLWSLLQPNSPYRKRKRPPNAFSENGGETKIWKGLVVDKQQDYEVVKNRYSALISGSSDLERLLRTLGRDTLVITGVGTNVCCESTARDAMMLDFKVIFVSDANATIGHLFHEITLMNIQMFFGDVVTTEQLLKEIKSNKT